MSCIAHCIGGPLHGQEVIVEGRWPFEVARPTPITVDVARRADPADLTIAKGKYDPAGPVPNWAAKPYGRDDFVVVYWKGWDRA